jgi:hypothetical protein
MSKTALCANKTSLQDTYHMEIYNPHRHQLSHGNGLPLILLLNYQFPKDLTPSLL